MSIKGSLQATILSQRTSRGLNNQVRGCHNVAPLDHSSLTQLQPYKKLRGATVSIINPAAICLYDVQTHAPTRLNPCQ